MTIKVLRKGNKDREVVCQRCNAKLRFEPQDARCINTAVGYAGETWEPEFVIDCPECEELIYVSRLLSEKAKDAAVAKYKRRKG